MTQIEGKGVWPLNILYEQKFLRQLWLRRFVRKLEIQSRLFATSWKPKKKKKTTNIKSHYFPNAQEMG